jgi:hypothetical protein
MKTFENAKWIWVNNQRKENVYGEFFSSCYISKQQTFFRLSCDSDYTLFINGKYVAGNQYGDFEHYKIYDEIDITEYLIDGENEFYLLVWHFGNDTQRYKKAQAGVIFEVEQNGKIILLSDESVLCRQSEAYLNEYAKTITPQLGFSFLYNANKENCGALVPATVVEKDCTFYKRPTKKLQLLSKKEISVLKDDGNYYLIDLGEETVGLPVLEFTSPTEQKILVAWGEDLQSGHVRRKIDARDFSFEYIAKKGKNDYTNYMLRLGCRYLELYAEQPIELAYLGLIPQVYPVEEKNFKTENQLDQKIYDSCVRTLELSMMEHYVDSPWREQCLYAFDSRNQMLCGYYAFKNGNAEYARANLLLMSKDRRADELLAISYPCGIDLTIPSFSLYYFMAVKEYIEYTGDISLGQEVYEKLVSIIEVFLNNSRNGLICSFEGLNHWNFYDWSEYLEGKLYEYDTSHPDLMINCLFILALENFRLITERIGKLFGYDEVLNAVKINAQKAFFAEKAGAYSLSVDGKEFTALGNSLAMLSGIAKNADELCERMVNDEFSDCSLSMKCFKYDALLLTNKEKWQGQVLNEIRKDYKKMLDAGATSVWETIDGASAFDNAGSLCHGWSAIPIYYFYTILGSK